MIKKEYDLIIIGGGATGAGIALDATLRGMKCLLIEKNDFAQGTSSRSTKLVHGGVRYLEAAIKKFDLAQFSLVKEGLQERYRLLHNAKFLAKPLQLATPIYSYFQLPYMYIGLSIYDFIAGKKGLGRSSILSRKDTIKFFPYVKKEKLKGAVQYYDGSFNDSRMVISLLQTAKENGCDVYNYHELLEFTYNANKINGVVIKDKILDKTFEVKTSKVINASGIFSDIIRKIDDKDVSNLLEVSSGLHIVLDKKYLPNKKGLMIPKTEDGRVLFILPWMDKCLVGTTDEKAQVIEKPKVNQKDIDYLLRHIKKYFDIQITSKDILSSWVGLRPLVINNDLKNTKEIVREHHITISKTGLISIMGGKWTTYRKMAEDTVDVLMKNNSNNLKECQTKEYKLIGNSLDIDIFNKQLNEIKLDKNLKIYLLNTYGDRIIEVYKYINKYGYEKISSKYEILIAEVYYSIDNEFVKTTNDFLIRRVNLSLIDIESSNKCFSKIDTIINTYKK